MACIIDSLGSGGAERQLTELAIGLKKRGHEVAVCSYHSAKSCDVFYESMLDDHGVELIKFELDGVFTKIYRIRKWLNSYRPDVVQSYLTGPNALAILTGIWQKKWKVVVSERIVTDYAEENNIRSKIITHLYRCSDWIICNSHANLQSLLRYIPVLKPKCSVIWNCVDLERFNVSNLINNDDMFHFLCVASMCSRKNVPMVVRALDWVRKTSNVKFHFRWIGNFNEDLQDHVETLSKTQKLVRRLSLRNVFAYAGESKNVEYEYNRAHALVLVSLNEGLPNTICEGMACGLPVVGSAVSDIPLMIEEGVNGFICDPTDFKSIGNALIKCLDLDKGKLPEFSKASRRMAEKMFCKDRFIKSYERLYYGLIA